jgi:V/A-type H+-transporting ATPase subunit E
MEPSANVESFIERLKKEGVEEANKKAQSILDEASLEAQGILKNAEEEARRILSHAREEVERNREIFDRALSQAARNLLMSLENAIIRLFDRVVEREVATALTPEVMKEMIIKLVDRWQGEEGPRVIEILFSAEDKRKIEEALVNALQKEMGTGVVLKPIQAIQAGFRIGEKDGQFHYDFTHKGIAEVLCEYLNPRYAKFLNVSEGDKLGQA